MTDPLFWLVLSLLFVTVSLTIVLVVAIPALRELARASRSAEKLFDTLHREFPPTLQAIRLTGMEISDLTDDVSEGVQSAGQVVKQVDQSLTSVRKQAQRVQSNTRSITVGIKAAWRAFSRSQKSSTQRRVVDRLPTPKPEIEFGSTARENIHANELTSENARPTTRRTAPGAATFTQNPSTKRSDATVRFDRTFDSADETPTSTAKSANHPLRSSSENQSSSASSNSASARQPEPDRLDVEPEDAFREP